MPKEVKKTDVEGQSPENLNDAESVDDLLVNISQFIEGVYRDLSIISPQRSSLDSTTRAGSGISLHNDSNSRSPLTSPEGASGLGSSNDTLSRRRSDVVFPRTRRNMDAEIERINAMCDNVDRNLRSIGLVMNNSTASNNTSVESLDSAVSMCYMSPKRLETPPTVSRKRHVSSRPITLDDNSQVIDLSKTPLTPPVQRRLPLDSNERDNDVILVASDIEVVDLCTPSARQEVSSRRQSTVVDCSQLNRRNLSLLDCEVVEEPPTPRKRQMQCSKFRNNKSNTSPSPDSKTKLNETSAAAASASHTVIHRCPVCMESYLQRQPTSTKCGHIFCQECITQAIRLTRKCPLCNTKINRNSNQTFRLYL